jgi:K+-sensing histidine kinase KdpD
MEITRKRTSRLQAVAAQFFLGIAGLALITFVCFYVGFGVARTSFAFVILIVLVSLLGSFSASVVLSIVAVACLNYFFVPPLFEFRVDDPDDIVRLAVFFTTSLVVTALTTKLRASEVRFRTFVERLPPSAVTCLFPVRPTGATLAHPRSSPGFGVPSPCQRQTRPR